MKFAIGLGVAGLAALVIAIATGRFDADPPSTTTERDTEPARGAPEIPAEHETLELAPGASVPLFDSPNGERLGKVTPMTESGERTVLSVADRRGEWLGVESGLAGTDPVAWVREQRKRLIPGETDRALVLIGPGTAEVRRGGEVAGELEITVSGEVAPGRYAVADRSGGRLTLTATVEPVAPGAPPGDPIEITAGEPIASVPIGAPVFVEG